MSTEHLPGSPAHSGLRAEAKKLHKVSSAQKDTLLHALNGDCEIQRLGQGDGLAGHYRQRCASAGFAYIKVFSQDQLCRRQRAEHLLRSLDLPGLLKAFDARPTAMGGHHYLHRYPWLAGRFAEPTTEDCQAIGDALGRLHAALKRLSGASLVEQRSRRRDATLEAIRQRLASGELLAGPQPDRLAALANAHGVAVLTKAQPVHGDLNHGNVMMVDGQAMILDFEDAPHSFQSPLFDLAMALERMVLVADAEAGRDLGEAMISAYRAHAPSPGSCLSAMLATLSLRALCLLADMERRGQAIPGSEWDKFFYLSALHQQHADMIAYWDSLL